MTPIGKLAGSAAYKDSTMIVVSDASLAFEYDEVRWSLERVNPTASDAKFWPSSNANLAPQGTSIQVLTVPNWMPPTFSQLFGYSNAENFRNLVTNGGYQLQATQPSWPQP